jgi:DNA-directed RNA polymerase specialized sigma24 family protein
MVCVATCAPPEPEPNSECGCEVMTLPPNAYAELRRAADGMLRGMHRCEDPTSLVHLAMEKAVVAAATKKRRQFKSPSHCMAVLKVAMRHALIDDRRKRRPQSVADTVLDLRAGRANPVGSRVPELIARLGTHDARQARIAQRKIEDYTNKEQAAIEGVSEATIEALWRRAKTWLVAHMGPDDRS